MYTCDAINLCSSKHNFIHKKTKEKEKRKWFSYIKSVWLGFYVSRLHWRRLVSNFQTPKLALRHDKSDGERYGDGPLSLCSFNWSWLMKFKAEHINWHNSSSVFFNNCSTLGDFLKTRLLQFEFKFMKLKWKWWLFDYFRRTSLKACLKKKEFPKYQIKKFLSLLTQW